MTDCGVKAVIAGMTAAVEAAEVGYPVVLVEKEPFLGGRVIRSHKYFPKMCPPTCGMEINMYTPAEDEGGRGNDDLF